MVVTTHGTRKLNLGCGEHKKRGFINVDNSPLVEPDVILDLNSIPFPFEDGEFALIEAFHVLEHLDKPFEVMRELHRILEPNGTLHIKVPHFSRGFTHAEHTHGFDITFPLYFNRGFTTSGFVGFELELEKMKISWLAFTHLMPYLGYSKRFIELLKGANHIVSYLANASPGFSSRIWYSWVGGFDEIEFVFKKKFS